MLWQTVVLWTAPVGRLRVTTTTASELVTKWSLNLDTVAFYTVESKLMINVLTLCHHLRAHAEHVDRSLIALRQVLATMLTGQKRAAALIIQLSWNRGVFSDGLKTKLSPRPTRPGLCVFCPSSCCCGVFSDAVCHFVQVQWEKKGESTRGSASTVGECNSSTRPTAIWEPMIDPRSCSLHSKAQRANSVRCT